MNTFSLFSHFYHTISSTKIYSQKNILIIFKVLQTSCIKELMASNYLTNHPQIQTEHASHLQNNHSMNNQNSHYTVVPKTQIGKGKTHENRYTFLEAAREEAQLKTQGQSPSHFFPDNPHHKQYLSIQRSQRSVP